MENNLQNEIDKMAKAIKTDNYPMSIGELANLYIEGDLNIHPVYQRLFRWDINQQSALIESILLNIPIPPIYVYQNEDGKWDLIDGQQRLSTIFKFMGILKHVDGEEDDYLKKEALVRTKFLPSLEGKLWDDEDAGKSLTEAQRRYIKRSKILIIIIDKSSDGFAQYEMFQRLNTGGSHLSPQEIRNCILVMQDANAYNHMKEMSLNSHFTKSLPISEKDMEEQGYLELVVKYLVLRYSKFDISDSANFNDFLTNEILNLISQNVIDFDKEKEIFARFFKFMYDTFDDSGFKRYDCLKEKFIGPVLVGTYELIIPGTVENLDYYEANSETLKNIIHQIPEKADYQEATKKGVRPISRIKKLSAFSKELFNYEKDN